MRATDGNWSCITLLRDRLPAGYFNLPERLSTLLTSEQCDGLSLNSGSGPICRASLGGKRRDDREAWSPCPPFEQVPCRAG